MFSSGQTVRQLTSPFVDGGSPLVFRGGSPALPGIPQNPTGAVAPTAVLFGWDAVSGATSYDYRIDGGSAVLIGNVTQFNLTGLTTDVQISFEVRARNAAGVSGWSTLINRTPTSSSEFHYADFESPPVDSAFYDAAISSGYQTGANPNGGTAYRYPYTNGQIGSPVSQTLRVGYNPTNYLRTTFEAWASSDYLPADGDHLLYHRPEAAPATPGFSGPGSVYLEQMGAAGAYRVQVHRSNDTWAPVMLITGAPTFNADIPRTFEMITIMNDVGSANGTVIVKIDGVEYLNVNNVEFRTDAGERWQHSAIGPYAAAVQTTGGTANVFVDNFRVQNYPQGALTNIALSHNVFNLAAYTPGRINLVSVRSELAATGTHQFLVGRFAGTRGAVSVRAVSAGDAHTNVDVVLSWADGEADYKVVDVVVPSKNPGDHRCWLQLSEPTGGAVLHNGNWTRGYGIIDDDTIASPSESVFFNHLETYDFTGPTSYAGSGTLLDPFNSIYEAIAYADANKSTVKFIYGEGVVVPDGVNGDLPNSSGGKSIHMPEARTDSTHLTIRNKPGSTLTIDGKLSVGGNKFGFFASNNDESFLHFRKINFQDIVNTAASLGFIWWHYGTSKENTVEKCVFDNLDGFSGGNNGAVHMWGVESGKVWDCQISNIKTGGSTTNQNTGGVYSYLGNNLVVQHCTFDSSMSSGIFHKRTQAGNVSCMSAFNIFNGCYLSYSISGGGDSGHDGIIAIHNLFKGPTSRIYHSSDTLIVPNAENTISNNYFYQCGVSDSGAIRNHNFQNAVVFNNIFHDCRYIMDWPNPVSGDELKYLDYNIVYNILVGYVAISSSAVSKASYQSLHGSAATHSIGANDVTTDPLPSNLAGNSAVIDVASDGQDSGVGGGLMGVFTNIEDVGIAA